MAGGVALILTQTADDDVVAASGVARHREAVGGAVIDNVDTGCRLEDLTSVVWGDFALKFNRHGDGVGAEYGHAHASDADAQVGRVHDTAHLTRGLDLFAVVATFDVDLVVVAEEVEGVGVR